MEGVAEVGKNDVSLSSIPGIERDLDDEYVSQRTIWDKRMEYVDRMARVRDGKPIEGDSEGDLKMSLKRFGVDWDRLTNSVKDMSLLVDISRKFNPDIPNNYALINQAAVMLRLARETETVSLPDSSWEYSFDGDGSIKALLACMTASTSTVKGRRERMDVFYPVKLAQRKGGGMVIEEVRRMRMTPQQVYMMERQAREVISVKSGWSRLYPDRMPMKSSRRSWRQLADGRIEEVVNQEVKKVYPDGYIGFPILPEQGGRADVLVDDSLDAYAAYDANTGALLLGKKLINSEGGKQLGRLVTTHELRHWRWDKLSAEYRRLVLACFDMSKPDFADFVRQMVTEKGSSYLEASEHDMRRDPSQESVEVMVQGERKVLGKERLVNELIAMASWSEVVEESELEGLGLSGERVAILKTARKCIAALDTTQRALLQSQMLIDSEDMNEDVFRLIEFVVAKQRRKGKGGEK